MDCSASERYNILIKRRLSWYLIQSLVRQLDRKDQIGIFYTFALCLLKKWGRAELARIARNSTSGLKIFVLEVVVKERGGEEK